ncbi:restriction endonuclease subunit S [Streptomyces sp. NBC_00568]|uniref:restriction endonuclease subunit S n=1 Tax=Streptomyces sp. NBC_00568 TaxID=2975779 RepID=UPI00224FCE47|nr:restriction endonuclease subunit S [Streptomyces sp. NBC_00568]MCX4989876.1 restriction endonuclease subunit S [Streptomyces sp. NBC_00568]
MELPAGWAVAELGDLLREPLRNGHSARATKEANGIRTLSLTAVTLNDFSDKNTKITSAEPGRVEGLWLEPGDILIQRSNTPELVGTSALYKGPRKWAIYPDLLIRVRVNSCILPEFAALMLRSKGIRDYFRSNAKGLAGSMPKIDQSTIAGVRMPVPPLAEQRRIVEALEDHLSRLDAAGRDLETARKKIGSFRKSIFLSLVPESVPASWEMSTVGDAGTVGLGRQRHPDWHYGPEMHPYLRVANVFEDRIDTSDVMEMDFSGVFDRYRLEIGDVLLNEGQSPHLVGRPALYRGTPPNVAFTNSLLRFQARPDVLPEWALLVFRRHLHARRFMREVRITTNIAHLSAKRLKPIEFPIPPLEEQKRRVQACDESMSYADAMERALKRSLVRANHLRSAVLERAFTGHLIPQDPADEPASVLLDHIRSEREAQGDKTKPTVRRPRKTVTAGSPPPPPTPSPNNAVQQELPL